MKNKATLIGSLGVKGLSLTSDADWEQCRQSDMALRVLLTAKLNGEFTGNGSFSRMER